MIIIKVATAATAAIMMVFFLSSGELLFFWVFEPLFFVIVVDEVFALILPVIDCDFVTAVFSVAFVVTVVMVVDMLVACVDFTNGVIGSWIKKRFVKWLLQL